MYTILYFSPTGNTKHLANKLAEKLNEETVVSPLEFLDVTLIEPNDHLILMYPIHGFNAPRTVKRFLKKLPEDLFNSVSLLAIGCNELWLNDAVSIDLRKTLTKRNYTIVLDEILAMPLTFVMSFPEETAIKTIDKAEEKLNQLSERIITKASSNRKISLKAKMINLVGKAESPAARMFGIELHAKKNCTSCGICWNNCPEYNIKENKKSKPKFGLKCSMCMRCIYDCPVKAITPRLSKFIPIKNGYDINELINKKTINNVDPMSRTR